MHWLGGFIADLPTPFDDDDRVDWPAFETLCEHQIRSGATAIVVGETMGEDSTLGRDEHEEIVAAAVDIARGRVAVIAGAGSNATSQALELTTMAEAAGADAIFPEAMSSREMFEEFAKRVSGVPLLANMTEFGKTPYFTASEFEAMGYRMVIWPVSSLRVANKAQQNLFAAIKRDGGAHKVVDQMQTRAELYATIGLHDYEALDASIVQTIIPETISQR